MTKRGKELAEAAVVRAAMRFDSACFKYGLPNVDHVVLVTLWNACARLAARAAGKKRGRR